jgi:hypothetical protein
MTARTPRVTQGRLRHFILWVKTHDFTSAFKCRRIIRPSSMALSKICCFTGLRKPRMNYLISYVSEFNQSLRKRRLDNVCLHQFIADLVNFEVSRLKPLAPLLFQLSSPTNSGPRQPILVTNW